MLETPHQHANKYANKYADQHTDKHADKYTDEHPASASFLVRNGRVQRHQHRHSDVRHHEQWQRNDHAIHLQRHR